MSTEVKHRRGTTAQHATFTGAVGEITVDTTKNTAVVHDGVTAGGYSLAKNSATEQFLGNAATATIAGTSGSFVATVVGFTVTPTPTVYWYKNNSVVHLHIPYGTLSGTSNSTLLSITNLPVDIQPTTALDYKVISGVCGIDNGVFDNNKYLYISGATLFFGNTYFIGAGSQWTASGSKALRTTEFMYTLV